MPGQHCFFVLAFFFFKGAFCLAGEIRGKSLDQTKPRRPGGKFDCICILKPENAGEMASSAACEFPNQADRAIHAR